MIDRNSSTCDCTNYKQNECCRTPSAPPAVGIGYQFESIVEIRATSVKERRQILAELVVQTDVVISRTIRFLFSLRNEYVASSVDCLLLVFTFKTRYLLYFRFGAFFRFFLQTFQCIGGGVAKNQRIVSFGDSQLGAK